MLGRFFRNLRTLAKVWRHPLHRGRRFAAARNWLRLLSAIRREPSHRITIPFVGNSVLVWPQESTSVGLCARYGLGEYAEMAFCLHALRPGDLFVDIGANAGVYTILASHAVGTNVVAIEPIPQTFDLLVENVHANGVAELVDAHRIGLGDKPGNLSFTSTLWSFNHVVHEGTPGAIEVPVHTLDSILSDWAAFGLKIDVEGFEAHVLEGGIRAIEAAQFVLIELADVHLGKFGTSVDSIESKLRAAGLHGPYWYNPATRTLEPQFSSNSGQSPYNRIFVRNMATISERLADRRSFQVHRAVV